MDRACGVDADCSKRETDASDKNGKNDEKNTYNIGGGKESYHGVLYQLRLLILCMLRGTSQPYSFKLATEQKEASKFDDLIFRSTNEKKQTTCRFLQAKHRSDSNKNITLSGLLSTGKGDFSLSKYFDSFLKIKENFKGEDIEIRDLLICTNIGFKEDDQKGDFKLSGIFEHRKNDLGEEEEDDLMQIKLLHFKRDFHGREKWIAHLKKNYKGNKEMVEDDINMFLEKLAFAIRHPGVEELRKIILMEMEERYKVIEVEEAFSWLQGVMYDWMSSTDGRYLTNKDGRFYLHTLQKMYGSIIFGYCEPVNNFTGRQSELDELRDAYEEGIKTVVITGLGGIGKSQLARKFIACNPDLFNSIIWLNSESYENLLASVQRLAFERLNIKSKTNEGRIKDIKSILEELYKYFHSKRTVFVFDNVENLHNERNTDGSIEMFLPKSQNKPFALITSRCQSWGGLKVINIEKFSEKEALDFVDKSIHKNKSEEKQIKTLVKELEYYPLALQQAVAFIRKENRESMLFGGKCGIDKYLDFFQQKNKMVLDQHVDRFIGDVYEKTTWTTWNITIEVIQEDVHGDLAYNILKLISFFEPDNISIKDIENCFQDLNVENIKSGLCLLCDYSMISIEKFKEVRIHRLVQWVTRLMLKEKGESEQTLKKALSSYRLLDVENVISIWDHTIDSETLAKNFCKIPIHVFHELMEKFRYEEAYLFGKKHVSRMERILSPLDKQYSSILHSFAAVTMECGKDEEAKLMYERVLQKQRSVFGDDHPEILVTMANLGLALQGLGKYEEAIVIYKRVLERQKCVLGDDHHQTLTVMMNMGISLQQQGNFGEAKLMLGRVLQKQKYVLGDDHPKSIITMMNLANLHQEQGNYDEAKLMYEVVLKKQKRILGDHNPETLGTMMNLGNLLQQQGKYEEAKLMYESLLEKQKEDNLPHTLSTMMNLGILLTQQGKYKEAKLMYETVLQRQKSLFGDCHHETLVTMMNLGNLLQQQGIYEEAKLIYEKVLQKQESLLGNDHPQTLQTMMNLGTLLKQQGIYEEAKWMYERVLQKQKNVFGDDHPYTLGTMMNLGNLFNKQGKYEEAKLMLGRVLQKQKNILGDEHPHTLTTLLNLGNCLQKQGKLEEALAVFQDCHKRQISRFGEDDPTLLSTLECIASLFLALKEKEKSLSIYNAILLKSESLFGSDHPNTLRIWSIMCSIKV